MKVSIVILNWNRKNDTLDCLRSVKLLSAENCDLSIIVIDNASSDNSQELIKKELFRIKRENSWECELIENEENFGFAAGNNVGIRHALNHGVDFVLILNNDTVLDKDLINEMLLTSSEHPKAGLISPKVYFAPGFEFQKDRYRNADRGKVIWYAGGKIDWQNVYGSNRGVDEVDIGQFEKIEITEFATGTCMLIRKKVLDEIGTFDDKFFLYYEDADFSQRAKRKGWQVLYSPKGHLWHKVAQSSGIGSELNDYFTTRNRLFFGMKYATIRTKAALIKESFKLLQKGRNWQKIGVRDYYLHKFGRGSWK